MMPVLPIGGHAYSWGHSVLQTHFLILCRFFNAVGTFYIKFWTFGVPQVCYYVVPYQFQLESEATKPFEQYKASATVRNVSIIELEHNVANKMTCASAHSDQSLGCPLEETFSALSYLLSPQQRLWSDWVDVIIHCWKCLEKVCEKQSVMSQSM